MPSCFLVHGASSPEHSAPMMRAVGRHVAARGYIAQAFDYDSTGIIMVMTLVDQRNVRLKWLGADLAARVRPGDAIIAYSMGCTIAYYAIALSAAPCSTLVLLAPNLDPDVEFPQNGPLKKIAVWYGESGGGPLQAAEWQGFPFHRINAMGSMGISGPDRDLVARDGRYVLHNKMKDFDRRFPSHDVLQTAADAEYLGPRIAADLPDLSGS